VWVERGLPDIDELGSCRGSEARLLRLRGIVWRDLSGLQQDVALVRACVRLHVMHAASRASFGNRGVQTASGAGAIVEIDAPVRVSCRVAAACRLANAEQPSKGRHADPLPPDPAPGLTARSNRGPCADIGEASNA